MKAKFRILLIVALLVVGILLALPWFAVGPGERHRTSSKAIDELNQRGPGRSWRVESVLGRDVARLFVQGQGCYLSRTLGPR